MTTQSTSEASTGFPANLYAATAEEGLKLALQLARKTVGAIQPDVETRKNLRPDYAADTDALIAAAGVTATLFSTIAQANNWWRSS